MYEIKNNIQSINEPTNICAANCNVFTLIIRALNDQRSALTRMLLQPASFLSSPGRSFVLTLLFVKSLGITVEVRLMSRAVHGAGTYLISVYAVALADVAGSAAGTIVRTRSGDALGFRDNQRDLVRLQLVVVHGQEPVAGVEVLQQTDVDRHRVGNGSLDQHVLVGRGRLGRALHARVLRVAGLHEANSLRGRVPLQPVNDPAALYELHEVVLRDAGRDIPSTVNGEVRAPR